MKRFLLAAALAGCLASPSAAVEPEPQLSLEQKALLRCSAAFAIIASEQERGIESALAWPPLGERGQEYFVQAGAQLMDELALSDEQIEAMMRAEVKRLQDESGAAPDPQANADKIMKACLLSLEVSGI